ncbi:hypothetical protein LCGC14_0728030 [marine sediment metagenome]|uniref:Uncharacterized protein n=1 Tax=marine sediment metagenome TaxID=412755 RepID=A0A0F9SVQ8_9ZZZZ
MPKYYVRNDRDGGAIVLATSRDVAIAVVNFGGTASKTIARRAKPGDRSWSFNVVSVGDYTERDGVIYLTEIKIRRMFRIPRDVTVYSHFTL